MRALSAVSTRSGAGPALAEPNAAAAISIAAETINALTMTPPSVFRAACGATSRPLIGGINPARDQDGTLTLLVIAAASPKRRCPAQAPSLG
jgi:hypothetical protein